MVHVPKITNLETGEQAVVFIRLEATGIWHVGLKIGHQSFTLNYQADDIKSAKWMANQLANALVKTGADVSMELTA